MFEKAQELAVWLASYQPAGSPGFAGRPPVAATKKERSTHPLDTLYRRRAISNDQYIAGLRLRADWELANIGADAVTDWSRFEMFPNDLPQVDEELVTFRRPAAKITRPVPSGIPARRYDAKDTLAKLRIVTGSFGFVLLVAVCVVGVHLKEISDAIRVHRDFLSLRLKEALSDAAAFYGEMLEGHE